MRSFRSAIQALFLGGMAVVKETTSPSSWKRWNYRTISPCRPFFIFSSQQAWRFQSSVTLPGDAAHLKPPVTGTVPNEVTLDTVELAAKLASDRFTDVAAAIYGDHRLVSGDWIQRDRCRVQQFNAVRQMRHQRIVHPHQFGISLVGKMQELERPA
jgi:2-polyprenyl-6-methoxyphenol hydroxylase-like FAD-dependent oxidoreductase